MLPFHFVVLLGMCVFVSRLRFRCACVHRVLSATLLLASVVLVSTVVSAVGAVAVVVTVSVSIVW